MNTYSRYIYASHNSAPSHSDEIEAALVEFFDAFRRSRARLSHDPGLARLSLAEFALLRAVDEHGNDGVGKVAKAADIAQPPASRGIERLKAKGLIDVKRHSGDARVTAVSVTPTGRRLLARHRARLQRTASLIATRLGADGATIAPMLLRLIAETLEEAAI
jgi:DNA-binding MarR family transcriptional regulator